MTPETLKRLADMGINLDLRFSGKSRTRSPFRKQLPSILPVASRAEYATDPIGFKIYVGLAVTVLSSTAVPA